MTRKQPHSHGPHQTGECVSSQIARAHEQIATAREQIAAAQKQIAAARLQIAQMPRLLRPTIDASSPRPN